MPVSTTITLHGVESEIRRVTTEHDRALRRRDYNAAAERVLDLEMLRACAQGLRERAG